MIRVVRVVRVVRVIRFFFILMIILLLSLFLLGMVALVAGWLRNRHLKRQLERGEIDAMPSIREARPNGCCGQHEVCEKESLLTAVSKGRIDYYEDEELDRFRGRASDSYSADEVELFEEVLTTMREEEVAGWVRSLQLREVNLPDELKDEVFLIIGERRFN